MFSNLWTKRPRPFAILSGTILFVISFFLVLYTLRFALRRSRTERVINILCFGDSLTAGSIDIASERTTTPKRHPYSTALQKHFNRHDRMVLGEAGEAIRPIFEVHTAGLPGERAIHQMLPRLKRILRSSVDKYDWVVILGGTNDLRNYLNSSFMGDFTSIFKAVVELHEEAHKFGARTVVVTLPDRECIGAGTCIYLKETQYKINELLREFAALNEDKVILADLAKEVVFPRDKKLWIDWVHFTPQGYDRMADIIYNAMKDYV